MPTTRVVKATLARLCKHLYKGVTIHEKIIFARIRIIHNNPYGNKEKYVEVTLEISLLVM